VGDPFAGPDAGPTFQSAEQVRTADIAALFAGLPPPNVRITRMRSDIAHAAMTKDFLLQASGDQTEITNVHTVTKGVNQSCPPVTTCSPWGCAASAPTFSHNRGGLAAVLAAMVGALGLVAKRKARGRSKT
jgi:hypothetical protein